jgi:hypothetical protein
MTNSVPSFMVGGCFNALHQFPFAFLLALRPVCAVAFGFVPALGGLPLRGLFSGCRKWSTIEAGICHTLKLVCSAPGTRPRFNQAIMTGYEISVASANSFAVSIFSAPISIG